MSQKIKIQTAKVLVVDDEPEITDIIETFLTEAGYSVTVENSPRDAVARARQTHPAVVILDIMMPERDGYQVCR
jgi:CheY-like chemotaxis protein